MVNQFIDGKPGIYNARRVRKFCLFFLLFSWPSASMAQEQACLPRADILARLENKFKEVPISSGVMTNGSLLEIVASENGTWSLIISHPTGYSCLTAAGERWETRPPKGRGI